MGRRQWETVVASAPRSLIVITNNQFLIPNLAVGGEATIDLFAPSGTVGQVQTMRIIQGIAPSTQGATSGSQDVIVTTTQPGASYMSANYNFDKTVLYNRFTFSYGDAPLSFMPNDLSALTMALKGATFDSFLGLRLFYKNSTNAALTNITLDWIVNWVKTDAA